MGVINLYSVAGYEQTSARVERALREFHPEADPANRRWKIPFGDRIVTVGLTDPEQLTLGPGLGWQIRSKLSRTLVVPKRIRSVVAVSSDAVRVDATPAVITQPDGSSDRGARVVASRIGHKLAEWDTVVVIHETSTDRLDRITPTRLLNH